MNKLNLPALPPHDDGEYWFSESEPGSKAIEYKKNWRGIISSNSNRIVLKGEILEDDFLGFVHVDKEGVWLSENTVKQNKKAQPPAEPKEVRVMLATPMAAELRRQVLDVNEDIEKIKCGWFQSGSKKEVPKCACYVGHHKSCDGDCYVWVIPGCEAEFEKFTLAILGLADLIKESQVVVNPGVRYSPTLSGFGGRIR